MNLKKKKALAVRALGVGEKRIKFLEPRLEEIKEALTKQDIRDLYNDGAIVIKNISGRKTSTKKKKKRSVGNVRKKVNKRKQEYVALTRKLRKHLAKIKTKLTKKENEDLRNKIKNKYFTSNANFKDYIAGVKK
ncbi:50S ribosomal protein L19e [uncultured archaeon]|nr:50S ribosomal protein L19e [uncultured archaeon]